MSVADVIRQRHWRRNAFAFFADYVGFGVGMIFANTTTTLPAFAAVLTDNKIVIGAISSLWAGGWLLPQIFAAHYLSDKPRKYPIMMTWELIGRPAIVLFVLWVALGGTRYASLTLVFFLLAIMVFRLTDALVALAYWDLFGKAVPAHRRGRLFGLAQVLTGVAAIGATAALQYLLGPNGPIFPYNYAAIFGLACAGFAVSTLGCALIVEVPEVEGVPEAAPTTSLRAYVPVLTRLWQSDPAFRKVTLVRVLSGLGGLATSFYVVYATDVLRLPPAALGLFAGAATAGSVLAGLVLGPVADRFGPQRVVKIVTWAECAVPLLALLCHLGVFGAAVNVVYPLLYLLLGLFEGSYMLGFNNYILAISPAGQRPTYMGLANTFAGLLIVVPILGGYLLEVTSYPVLFGVAALGTLGAAVLALSLAHPSPVAPPDPQPVAVP